MAAQCLQQIAIAELSGAPTAQSFLRLAVRLATEINKEVSFKGGMKMAQVQGVLRMALEEPIVREKLSPELIVSLTAMIDTVIPEAITIAVQASRGEISLKKPTVGCVASLCGLFCRAAIAAAPLVLPPAPAPSPVSVPSAVVAEAEAPVKEAVEKPQETADATPTASEPQPEEMTPEVQDQETKESSVSAPAATEPPAEAN
jgi:hypothetical protein